MSNAQVVREEFDRAFQSMQTRALFYEDGPKVLAHIFKLSTTANFYVLCRKAPLMDYYEEHINSHPLSAKILDSCFDLIHQLEFNLALHQTDTVTSFNKLHEFASLALSSRQPVKEDETRFAYNPDLQSALASYDEVRVALLDHPWLFALALIRLFKVNDLTAGE